MGRVRATVLDVAVECPAQPLDRVAGGRSVLVGTIELREAVVDDAIDERRLVAEVVVDGGRRDSRAEADLADRQPLFAAAGEQRLGGVEDRAPGRFRFEIAGSWRRRSCVHRPDL